MPDGADAVAMQEFCDTDDGAGTVRILRRPAPGSNNRPAGENLREGETIARSGCRLGAAEIGILSAAGQATVDVQKLRVGLLSMGDEVVPAGAAPVRGNS